MFTKTSPPEEAKNPNTPKEETLGSFLKAARLSQDLDLTTISQATRINHNCLIALEEDNRAALPADVYSRGFVKLYASHLKLDPQEAIHLYEKQWDPKKPINTTFHPQKDSPSLAKPGIIISLLLIAIVFGIRLYYPGQADTPSPLLPANQVTGTTEATLPPAGAPDITAEAAIKTSDLPTPASPEKAETVAADTSSQTPVTSPPPYEIQLQSGKTTEIEIILDGQKAVKKTLQPGSKQIWQAEKNFDLTLDSTSEITLTVNGVIIPITTEAGPSVTIHRP